MKTFCFTVDDNIRFLKEITAQGYRSLFDHPYPAMLRRLHERFSLKVQLNLFYRMDGFDLSGMSDRYAAEWEENADWMKLSFHSDRENVSPYENSGYDVVFADCRSVNEQILRIASPSALAQTTTVHYCRVTDDGLRALADNGVRGLLGLFGTEEKPNTSYGLAEGLAGQIRAGKVICRDRLTFAGIDMIINKIPMRELLPALSSFFARDSIRVMIHEQYFYSDYPAYQPDFEEKLIAVFDALHNRGYVSRFFEELI
ncbi:MAG: hypothetical protein IKD37_08425 [Clostridia bacterium]|nr:hypothetical protein [Clostridia bacterium]